MKGHTRRRGRTWTAIVDVPRGEDNKRKQQWFNGFRTKKEAEQKLTEVLGSLRGGTFVEPSKQTVGAFMDEWLTAIGPTIRPSTFRSYSMNVRCHITPRFGSTPLQNLTASAINALYGDLLATGRVVGKGGLSPQTVHYVHVLLRKALAAAVKWNRLPKNPADSAEPPRQRQARTINTWTAAELRAFLARAGSDRLYAAFHLLGSTGLRRGEALGLHWRDIDLDGGTLAVTTTLLAVRGEVSWGEPKTAKGRRSVALDRGTIEVLRQHRTRQLEERLAWGGAYANEDIVFTRENGSAVHPDLFSQLFNRLVRDSELPRIRLHDLRHTHATLALQAGVHPKVVSERLGHAGIGITLDTYSHAIPAMEIDAAERVAALVAG